jgi:hypothetical protein
MRFTTDNQFSVASFRQYQVELTLRKALHPAMDAHFATARRYFALAARIASGQKEPAFQASSPKTFTGWSSDRPVFLCHQIKVSTLAVGKTGPGKTLSRLYRERMSASVRRTISILVPGRERTDQLIEPGFILHARSESATKPVQTPCQKQHGPLPFSYAPIIA